jgi:hypothetical protein
MAAQQLLLLLLVLLAQALVAPVTAGSAHLVVRVGGPDRAVGQGQTLALSLAVVNAGDV